MDAEQGQLSPCILAAWQPANRPKLLISFVSSRKHSQYISVPLWAYQDLSRYLNLTLHLVTLARHSHQSTLAHYPMLAGPAGPAGWCDECDALIWRLLLLWWWLWSTVWALAWAAMSCLSLRQLRVSSIPMGQARERLWQGEDMIEQYWTSFVFSLVKVCYGFLSSYVDISMYCVCFRGALLFIARFLFQIGLGILGLSQR